MAVLALLIALFVNQIESSTISSAYFYPEQTGIDGYISALNGFVWWNLDFTAVNWTALPANCSLGGLKWHVHTAWTYGDSDPAGSDRMLDECAYNFTGNHYDPWFACGSASSEVDCQSNGGCIPPSSIYEEDDGEYYCDQANYDLVAYTCEVGDWSGKYGTFEAAELNNVTGEWEGLVVEDTVGSYWETDRVILSPGSNVPALYSMVLHCNSGERVFCAPILRDNAPESSTDLTDDQIIETDFSDAGADFANFTVKWQASGMTVNIPATAAALCDEYAIKLYTDYPYPGTTVDCDLSLLGGIYDPTHTCIDESGSPYCTNGTRCAGNSSMSTNTVADYSCSADDDWFGCAVGDINARIGSITVPTSGGTFYPDDPKSPPLFILGDKAIVFECVAQTNDTNGFDRICANTEQTNGTVVTLTPVETDEPTPVTESPTTFEPTMAPTITDQSSVLYCNLNILFIVFITFMYCL